MPVPYRPGGLMRCCTLTLALAYDPAQRAKGGGANETQGAKLPCRSCSTTMIFHLGYWQRDLSAKNKYGDVPIPTDAELA